MTSSDLLAIGAAEQLLIGWVDESYRAAADGHYVLAAAVIEATRVDAVRAQARAVPPKGAKVFHWRDERPELRMTMLKQVVGMGVGLVVAVSTPVDSRRQQRARALCLKRLAWELAERGVRELVIESRGEQDAQDRKVLAGLHRAGEIPKDLIYRFDTKDEPALWVPDAIAGAVGEDRCGGDGLYLAVIDGMVELVEIPPP